MRSVISKLFARKSPTKTLKKISLEAKKNMYTTAALKEQQTPYDKKDAYRNIIKAKEPVQPVSTDETPLFPYMLGNQSMADSFHDKTTSDTNLSLVGGKDYDRETSTSNVYNEWLNTDKVITHNGKNYITSGNNMVGDGDVLDGEFVIYNDSGSGNTFLAINPDDPNDTIVVQGEELEFKNYLEVAESDYVNEKSDGTIDKTRTNWVTPDTLNIEKSRIKSDGTISGRYKNNLGNPKKIKIIDVGLEDIKTTNKWTKYRIDMMPNKTDRDAVKAWLLEGGINYEDLPDE